MNYMLTKEQKQYQSEICNFVKAYFNNETKLDLFFRDLWSKIANFGLLGIKSTKG